MMLFALKNSTEMRTKISLWPMRVMAVLEGKGIHDFVIGERIEPPKEDVSAINI